MIFGLYTNAGVQLATTISVTTIQTGNIITSFSSPYTVLTSGFYYTATMIQTGSTIPLTYSLGTGLISSSVVNYPNNTPNQVNNGNLARYRVCGATITPTTSLPANLNAVTIFSSPTIFYTALN
jgi:hypothetical protein